ncbi:MAG: HTH-type transcriptional activator CmpR [Bacteroidota bacterium]|jgi:DNA-binding transcriptional LysR family regulator
MHFTLQQLIIFHALVQTKSVTKTADQLHLTQPAVSIQLKNMQKLFDQKIFETIGKKIYITPFGEEIYQRIDNMIQEAENIQQLTKTNHGILQGQLKIAVVSTGKYVMPYFISDFLQSNPLVELHMDVSNKQQVLERLKKNEVDFALISILPEKINLKKIDLIDNKLYMVGKKKNKNENIETNKSLNQCTPLIYREAGSGTRQIMEKFIERKKIKPVKPIELTSNEAIKQAILSGMGYSIMPLIGLKNEILNQQLEIIKIPGLPIKTTWQLVWLAEKKNSHLAQSYLTYLRKNKESILSEHFQWYGQSVHH